MDPKAAETSRKSKGSVGSLIPIPATRLVEGGVQSMITPVMYFNLHVLLQVSEILLYQHHFCLIDKDGGGTVDAEELRELLVSFGTDVSLQEVSEKFFHA